ncbi:hypothetical protein [Fimbriimonas ginsengisoli]|uniref:Uncharacterized protein n=1 Tax=Fimbriimonas ginsengisoli Gsoil 348 TaxID=661478 RepID=A0A068NM27_FIMGI|nr:hypothetical protein [Fimbriimonas ginsengisoli]AIE84472.1 hypothetical protein OP10G_1104 [Fimbriimonas ginsengisoli Gsoil 348]
MQRKNWKTISATCGLTLMAIAAPQMSHATWPVYKRYEVPGFANLPNAALAVNSYNYVAGSANYGSNVEDYTAMFGGANTSSTFYNMPNHWNSMQMNGLNNKGQAVGTAWISGHPTALYTQPGQPTQNMQAGLTYTYQSIGSGVNHFGIAVGSYNRMASSGVQIHMFRWDPVQQARTGDWLNLIPGGINEDGLMAAVNIKPTNYYQLCELALVPATGNPTMKTAPGYFTWMQPNSISTYGGITVVGDMTSYLLNASNSYKNGFAYNRSQDKWLILDGVGNPYFETHGLGVDVWGTKAVGYTVDQNGEKTATVWEYQNGAWNPTPVSALLPADLNWKYTEATAISPVGAISGIGLRRQGKRWVPTSFVLTPNALIRLGTVEGGIYGGLTASSTVHLDGRDPFSLNIEMGADSSLIGLLNVVRIEGGATSATFSMRTQGVDARTPVSVRASLGGFDTVQQYLLLPAVLEALTVRHTDGGGEGTVTLRGNAGPSGDWIRLTSSDPNVTVPAKVRIEKGGNSAPFRITIGKDAKKGTVVTFTAYLADGSVRQTFTVG